MSVRLAATSRASSRPRVARLAQDEEAGPAGGEARGGGRLGSIKQRAELWAQKDSLELLLIAEPVLGLRNRRSEWLCDEFLCDHLRSLDGRERNCGADY